jgi:transcriptional regulator NrdR family protein
MPKHSILCPFCGREGQVKDSRRVGGIRVRVRRCKTPGCHTTWKTTEGSVHEVVGHNQNGIDLALG